MSHGSPCAVFAQIQNFNPSHGPERMGPTCQPPPARSLEQRRQYNIVSLNQCITTPNNTTFKSKLSLGGGEEESDQDVYSMCCSCIQATLIEIAASAQNPQFCLYGYRSAVFMFRIEPTDRKAFLWAFLVESCKLSLQRVQTNRRDKVSLVTLPHPMLLHSSALHVI